MRDPLGHDTRYQKVLQAWSPTEQLGDVRTVTDALGQITTTVLNLAGQPMLVTDPLGRSTHYAYDGTGNLITLTDPENHVTSFEYEPTFNRVTRITDALNQVTQFEYDAQGNLTATEDPTSARTTLAYNAFGQPTRVTDALNNITTFEYDNVGNLIATSDPLGNTTRRAYDAVSRLTDLTDPRGFTTHYDYDDLNRVTQITDALNGMTAFGYDSNGNLLTVTDANNHSTTYGYDNMDRLETRADPLNRSESYSYDPSGNLATFTDRKGQLSQFSYDAVNRRAHAQYADGSETSFVYDAGGRMVAAEDSTSGRIEQTYDDRDRLVRELTPQGVVSYGYDVLGRRDTMTVGGQSPVSYHYDAASRLTQVSQGTLTVGLGYDVAGRRSSLAYPNGVTTNYGYDTASRLTSILHQGPTALVEALTYTYDAAGNRIGVTRANDHATVLPEAVQAAYDAANEQVQFGSTVQNLIYDLNGNLTNQTDTIGETSYTWDARNRLIAINGLIVNASFSYDAMGRRSTKSVNGITTQYLYDGQDVAQELRGGVSSASYIRSLNIDESFIRIGPSTEYYHADAVRSSIVLTDMSGTAQTRYQYEPFGRTSRSGPNSSVLQYTGREDDGAGLFYYRARYYSPVFQRFISEDQIGFNGGDHNFYAYVGNNPTNFIDPLGLIKIKGAHDEPIFVHPNDADKAHPSDPHGHIGSPNSPLKVDAYTGEIYRGAEKTGERLSKKGLKELQKALKKAGLLGLGLTIVDIAMADDALAALGEAIDPFGLLSGELSADDMLPDNYDQDGVLGGRK